MVNTFPGVSRRTSCPPTNGKKRVCINVSVDGNRCQGDDKIHAKMQFRNVSSPNERVPTRMALNFKGHSAVISLCVYDYIIPQNVCDASEPPSLPLSSSCNDRAKYNYKCNYNRITYSYIFLLI